MKPVIVRALIPLGLLVAGWLGYASLSVEKAAEKHPEPEERVIKTEVIELHRQDFQTVFHIQGVARAHNEAPLTTQVAGKVKSILPGLEDGAFFSQGELLLELDDQDFQTEVIAAEAQVARATAVHAQEQARAKQARLNWEDLGYTDEPNELVLRLPQLREAEANVKAAQAALEQAERDLTRTKVRAPFDGRVLERSVAEGQSISSSTPLATIFKTDFVEVRLPISANELVFLDIPESADEPSMEVTFYDALTQDSDSVWEGRIVGTEGALDENSRELFAIARVDDPFSRQAASGSQKPPLRVGQPVRAAIPGKTLEDVYVIPRATVRNLNRIYLVDEDSMLDRRTIEEIWSNQDFLVVRDDSIEEGALLATSRLVYAPDASKVEVIGVTNSTALVDDAPLVTSQDLEGEGAPATPSPGS